MKHASDFHYVRLPVSIRPRDPWTLRHLAVEIQLQSSIGEAVAWSMAPEKVVSEVKTKVNASLGSTFKLAPLEVSAKSEASDEYVTYQPNITAFNLGASDPAWEFWPTRGNALSGIQLLHLVVRQPRQAKSRGSVVLRAELAEKWRLLKLFGRVDRAEGVPLTFECG